MKKKMIRSIAAICAVLVAVTVFGACGDKKDEGVTVMTVNGKAVDADIFQYEANMVGVNCVQSLLQVGMITDISQMNWDEKAFGTEMSYTEYVKDVAKTRLTSMYALIVEGEKKGIAITENEEKELDDYITKLKESYGADFENALKRSGYSNEAAFEKIQKIELLYQKVKDDASKDISKYVSIDELKAMNGPEMVTVKHILVAFDDEGLGDVTDEKKAAAKKEAEEILKKLNAGEDFDKLMAEYNDDPGATPEGYTFADDGTMVQQFTDASFALEIGGTSGLVETTYGYHIIRRMERRYTLDEYLAYLTQNADVKLIDEKYSKLTITVDLKAMLGY